MLLLIINLFVLASIAAGTWWLTGLDKTVAGESIQGDHLVRALRCIAVVFLAAIFLRLIESPLTYGDIPLLILVPTCTAIVLRSSLSEIFAHGFLRGLDPALYDNRPYDPRMAQRHQDDIARLIRAGRRAEAIKLCEELKQSGEVDELTLEHTLEFLGVKSASRKPVNPLNEAARLRDEQKFTEAGTLLQSLLKKNPDDEGAALMLMRLYAESFHQPERAYEVLRALEKRPHFSRDHLQFARHSIPHWAVSGRGPTALPDAAPPAAETRPQPSAPRPAPEPAGAAAFDPSAVDRLLDQGCFGSAVAMLEQQAKARPADWALHMKLAEVYAVHCKDLVRAEKIVHRLEQQPGFGTEQTAYARAKLENWRTAGESKPRQSP